ncbi:hypothetical protein DACRYDRAFT_105145 [Dacryopinax primogenitus]|uniref:Uncharacterized protein n=1 Tax=Dacryopinax primogenitus (strain DJM 731) TaxID=1858805 RepID=M5G5T5_DACPD|nr:uncharacterized protein DACRYDRAFT_105145 [Dacryopinax primogenitus]EJU04079.1 hypothetical protein DACRYDRAFT_105145 [Dacryopinax primogenitus]
MLETEFNLAKARRLRRVFDEQAERFTGESFLLPYSSLDSPVPPRDLSTPESAASNSTASSDTTSTSTLLSLEAGTRTRDYVHSMAQRGVETYREANEIKTLNEEVIELWNWLVSGSGSPSDGRDA